MGSVSLCLDQGDFRRRHLGSCSRLVDWKHRDHQLPMGCWQYCRSCLPHVDWSPFGERPGSAIQVCLRTSEAPLVLMVGQRRLCHYHLRWTFGPHSGGHVLRMDGSHLPCFHCRWCHCLHRGDLYRLPLCSSQRT